MDCLLTNDSMNQQAQQTQQAPQVRQAPTCTNTSGNCTECCNLFTDPALRAAFGYQIETAVCQCHDLCVEDVRDVCVHTRTLRFCVPCNPDGMAGCRGGVLPDGAPAIQNVRVLCASERLSPATGCDRVINDIEFEVVLRFGVNTFAVVTPKDTVTCFFNEFARFPSGVFFTNNAAGRAAFRNELALIDGSCKVIIIENVRIETSGNNCVLVIDYKVIDKLWKHEDILVSAIAPYGTNITVKEEFEQGHQISPCADTGTCPGAAG